MFDWASYAMIHYKNLFNLFVVKGLTLKVVTDTDSLDFIWFTCYYISSTLGKCPRVIMRYSSCSWELLNIFICQTDGAYSDQGMGFWLVLVLPLQLSSHVILENMFNL